MQRKRVGSDGAERLGRIEALGDLSLGQRRELARLADEITAEPGETIMREGDPGYEVVMLEAGTAEVVQDGQHIGEMGPGAFFGELAVLADGATRTASVLATSELRAIVLTAHFMREVRRLMPPVAEHVDRIAAERLERDARAGS